MELNAFYIHNPSLGYGLMGTQMTAALQRAGVTTFDRMPGSLGPDEYELNRGRTEGLTSTVCWMSYPTHAPGWWSSQYSACLSMWESNKLPEAMRAALDNYDLIIVPSQHNVDLFSQWHPNVRYCPLGVDPTFWTPTRRIPPDRYFRFLTAGSGPRKGTELVREAFLKLFPDGSWGDRPIPVLQIKQHRDDGRATHPRIETICGKLTATEERNLYAQAHVYVQMSRGEGFGLQPLQAIVQGVPTILTEAHGHKAFAHYGMGVNATLEHHSKAGGYFSFGDAGDWWEPSFDELCDWMLYCYDNYEIASADARLHALDAHKQFTWDKAAAAFIDCFPEGQLDRPFTPGEWKPLTQRKYRVRVIREHTLDVAGIVHSFKPGRDYWECADLKRLLFDGEWLDPSCLDDADPGLTEVQLARLADYRSDREVCPTCHQVLNSGAYRDEEEAV